MSRPLWARRQQHGICPYCGQESDQLTLDHVIPQGLFPRPRPNNMPKVMTCPACNNQRKSPGDTYLRDLLVNDLHSASTPAAQQIRADSFARAVRENHSAFARDATWSRTEEIRSPSGIIIGSSPLPSR